MCKNRHIRGIRLINSFGALGLHVFASAEGEQFMLTATKIQCLCCSCHLVSCGESGRLVCTLKSSLLVLSSGGGYTRVDKGTRTHRP